MRVEEYNAMLADYQSALEGCDMDMTIGSGWVPLIREILSVTTKADQNIRYVRIKEKLGMLAMYTWNASDEIQEYIQKMRSKSTTICETCGADGFLCCGNAIIKTSCQLHKEHHEQI